MKNMNSDEIRTVVREDYGKVVLSDKTVGSCNPDSSSGIVGCGTSASKDNSFALGYSNDEVNSVPAGSNLGLGCGNPQAIASLKNEETVLDLGSGAGFDSFLAAPAVGKSGKVIGVDMTPEMLDKARANMKKSEYNNIEFRLSEIENLPVPNETVDVIISNCVINLSPEKKKVFQEGFRVLKSRGRLAISDTVASTELPDKILEDPELYSECVSGALSINELKNILGEVGFEDIRIKPKEESKEFIGEWVPGSNIEEYVLSATIEAVKPR